MEKEQLNPTSTGLIRNGAVWVENLYLVPNKSQTILFWILEVVLFWKTIIIYVWVSKVTQKPGWFGQGLTVNIWECNNQLELSVYNMCCSYMVLTSPNINPWIQFITMKIFMKIVQICPKSPRFTVQFFSWMGHVFDFWPTQPTLSTFTKLCNQYYYAYYCRCISTIIKSIFTILFSGIAHTKQHSIKKKIFLKIGEGGLDAGQAGTPRFLQLFSHVFFLLIIIIIMLGVSLKVKTFFPAVGTPPPCRFPGYATDLIITIFTSQKYFILYY